MTFYIINMVFQVIVGVTKTESVGTFYVHLDSRCRGKSLVETLLKSKTSVNRNIS